MEENSVRGETEIRLYLIKEDTGSGARERVGGMEAGCFREALGRGRAKLEAQALCFLSNYLPFRPAARPATFTFYI